MLRTICRRCCPTKNRVIWISVSALRCSRSGAPFRWWMAWLPFGSHGFASRLDQFPDPPARPAACRAPADGPPWVCRRCGKSANCAGNAARGSDGPWDYAMAARIDAAASPSPGPRAGLAFLGPVTCRQARRSGSGRARTCPGPGQNHGGTHHCELAIEPAQVFLVNFAGDFV